MEPKMPTKKALLKAVNCFTKNDAMISHEDLTKNPVHKVDHYEIALIKSLCLQQNVKIIQPDTKSATLET
ncbi:4454_t:CDS:2 [Gigaspora margarita]|uniref:4454_t:CDS:1 n=1 Tax=Gigaspora margarita TaxID=4874 RepID=A0ABM8W397_GIGMA|nr:4454_t:CDS:2 [Gigaspora margarita]